MKSYDDGGVEGGGAKRVDDATTEGQYKVEGT
jgi:hypothetical protein